MHEQFEILYHDRWLVAVNKPPGMLVHRTKIAPDKRTCLDLLRDQVGHHVFAAHRLDRKTSGVLIFATSGEAAGKMGVLFQEREIAKNYLAVVRGWVMENGRVDRPLRETPEAPEREAATRYEVLHRAEVPHAVGPFPTARYSLVAAMPETGRMHQIRRHMAGINHPILGDRVHGDNKHNRFARESLETERMLLHAASLRFIHPWTEEAVTIKAPLEAEFTRVLSQLGLFLEPEATSAGRASGPAR